MDLESVQMNHGAHGSEKKSDTYAKVEPSGVRRKLFQEDGTDSNETIQDAVSMNICDQGPPVCHRSWNRELKNEGKRDNKINEKERKVNLFTVISSSLLQVTLFLLLLLAFLLPYEGSPFLSTSLCLRRPARFHFPPSCPLSCSRPTVFSVSPPSPSYYCHHQSYPLLNAVVVSPYYVSEPPESHLSQLPTRSTHLQYLPRNFGPSQWRGGPLFTKVTIHPLVPLLYRHQDNCVIFELNRFESFGFKK